MPIKENNEITIEKNQKNSEGSNSKLERVIMSIQGRETVLPITMELFYTVSQKQEYDIRTQLEYFEQFANQIDSCMMGYHNKQITLQDRYFLTLYSVIAHNYQMGLFYNNEEKISKREILLKLEEKYEYFYIPESMGIKSLRIEQTLNCAMDGMWTLMESKRKF